MSSSSCWGLRRTPKSVGEVGAGGTDIGTTVLPLLCRSDTAHFRHSTNFRCEPFVHSRQRGATGPDGTDCRRRRLKPMVRAGETSGEGERGRVRGRDLCLTRPRRAHQGRAQASRSFLPPSPTKTTGKLEVRGGAPVSRPRGGRVRAQLQPHRSPTRKWATGGVPV